MHDSSNPRAGQLRSLISWALLAYVAVIQFFAFLNWLIPAYDGDRFVGRSFGSADRFLSLFYVALIVVALLLAAGAAGATGKLMATIALIELAFMLVFGLLSWLIGLGDAFDGSDRTRGALIGLEYLVANPLAAVIIALAALWVMGRSGLNARMPSMPGRTTAPPSDVPPAV